MHDHLATQGQLAVITRSGCEEEAQTGGGLF